MGKLNISFYINLPSTYIGNMDPITHIASGVLGAQAFRRHFPEARLFTPFCLLAAWIPDADIFFNRGNPEWSLLYHRGISTSFFGGFIMALALAGIYKLISRKTAYWKACALAFGLICVHIWLDLATSYGTQLLAPFSDHRFTLDALFIIDPIFTLGVITFILFSLFKSSKSNMITTWGLIFIFAYPVATMAIGSTLEALVKKQYERSGFTFNEYEFIPDAFTPLYWKVISREGEEYTLTLVNTFIPGKEYPMKKGIHADHALLEKLGRQDSIFTTWEWFARYPVQETLQTGQGTTILFRDLRFSSVHPILSSLFNKGQDTPFTLKAELDENGDLVSWELNRTTRRFVRQAME